MANLNKVFLIGRLTFDPELRYTASGIAVVDLRLATTRTYQGKDGERKEDTLYIDVTVWNRQAETCCQYLKKGRQVHVDGYLKSESWDDKTTGEKRSKIKVEAERVQFLDGPKDGMGASDDDGSASAAPPRDAAPRRAPNAGSSFGNGPPRSNPNPSANPAAPPRRPTPPQDEPEGDDDIPF